jgi:hypothetical protein
VLDNKNQDTIAIMGKAITNLTHENEIFRSTNIVSINIKKPINGKYTKNNVNVQKLKSSQISSLNK